MGSKTILAAGLTLALLACSDASEETATSGETPVIEAGDAGASEAEPAIETTPDAQPPEAAGPVALTEIPEVFHGSWGNPDSVEKCDVESYERVRISAKEIAFYEAIAEAVSIEDLGDQSFKISAKMETYDGVSDETYTLSMIDGDGRMRMQVEGFDAFEYEKCP